MNQVGLPAKHQEEGADQARQEVEKIVNPGEQLAQKASCRRMPGESAGLVQARSEHGNIDAPVWNALPWRVVGDVFIKWPTSPRNDHRFKATAIEITHQVAQADHCAPVANSVLDEKDAFRFHH